MPPVRPSPSLVSEIPEPGMPTEPPIPLAPSESRAPRTPLLIDALDLEKLTEVPGGSFSVSETEDSSGYL